MKKFILPFVIIFLFIFICGCDSQKSGDSKSGSIESENNTISGGVETVSDIRDFRVGNQIDLFIDADSGGVSLSNVLANNNYTECKVNDEKVAQIVGTKLIPKSIGITFLSCDFGSYIYTQNIIVHSGAKAVTDISISDNKNKEITVFVGNEYQLKINEQYQSLEDLNIVAKTDYDEKPAENFIEIFPETGKFLVTGVGNIELNIMSKTNKKDQGTTVRLKAKLEKDAVRDAVLNYYKSEEIDDISANVITYDQLAAVEVLTFFNTNNLNTSDWGKIFPNLKTIIFDLYNVSYTGLGKFTFGTDNFNYEFIGNTSKTYDLQLTSGVRETLNLKLQDFSLKSSNTTINFENVGSVQLTFDGKCAVRGGDGNAANTGYSAITSKDLDINVIKDANVSIIGGNGGSAYYGSVLGNRAGNTGITANNVSLTSKGYSENTNIVIKGGNGGNGYSAGESGGNGGNGINSISLKVDMLGVLTIYGGNGGYGASLGANGADGGSAIISNNISIDITGTLTVYGGNGGNGNNGSYGSKGGNGGNGGSGGRAITPNSVKMLIVGGNVTLIGGNGGHGGNGGKGNPGRDGQMGLSSGYSDGNKGGDGGNGGNGGNGNKAISSDAYISVYGYSILLAINGNGGNGGDGGDGGDGGNGGPDVGTWYWAEPFGLNGADGGKGGKGGKGGDGNNPGNGGKGGESGKGGKGTTRIYGFFGVTRSKTGRDGIKPTSLGNGESGSINFYAGDRTYVDGSGIVVYGYNTLSNNEFLKGIREYAVYDNNHKGVTIENIPHSSDNQLGLPYEMKITSKLGSDNRHMGGYYGTPVSSANAVFYYTIYAKIPTGYSIDMYNYEIGDGAHKYWLTENKGTGEWQWYIGVTECGTSGKFSTLGYVAIYANDDCTNANADNIVWYVGYSQVASYQPTTKNNTKTKTQIEYNGHSYQIIAESLSWEQAKFRAEELGGHLVIINSANEENAIVAAMRSEGLKRIWIGLNDVAQESVFKWVDGTVAEYTNFNYGQPDNYGNTEHYFEICVDIQPQVYWNDVPLQYDTNQGFIVEFDEL